MNASHLAVSSLYCKSECKSSAHRHGRRMHISRGNAVNAHTRKRYTLPVFKTWVAA